MSNITNTIFEKESFDKVKILFCIIGAPIIFSLTVECWSNIVLDFTPRECNQCSGLAYTEFECILSFIFAACKSSILCKKYSILRKKYSILLSKKNQYEVKKNLY